MKKNKMMMVTIMMMTTTNNLTEASVQLTPKPAIGRILQLVLPVSYPNNLFP
jgi:hypothetical protein